MSHPPHILGESLRRGGTQRIRKQIEVERQHVSRLGVGGQSRRRRDVLALERGANVIEQRAISARVVFASEHRRRSAEQVGGMREVRRRDEILVGRRARIVRTSRLERQPITEVKALGPEESFSRLRTLVFHPGAHARVLARENAGIAVGLIDVPWDNHRHVRPTSAGGEIRIGAPDYIGNDPRHGAIGMLVGGNVRQPLREKPGDVHVERRRPREHLRVPGPAKSLVTLRTVGRNVEKVAALSPDDVLLQTIYQRI